MKHATIQITPYISARGIVVSENPASGLVTIRDGARLYTGRPLATRSAA